MNVVSRSKLLVPLIALAVAGSAALAQGPTQSQTDPQAQQQPMRGMMGGQMMGRMAEGKQGMMGQSMMCPMMQGGMMPGGMTQTDAASGMAGLFGARVTPLMNLSVEDVRGYLIAQLDRLDNKRLKIGDTTADAGTITPDIVTVDNSLVQRLKVDRRTGVINYEG